jgi:non-ribosomal peptide synthetase-like protein
MLSTNETRTLLSFDLLHKIFETQAEERPDAVAVLLDGNKTSYAELEQQANRLARYLRLQGIQGGSLVAVLLPRSVDMYAAILSILKIGAAYVPLDPEYPIDRISYILKDSGAGALVTTGDLADRHNSFGGMVIRMDTDRHAINSKSVERLPQGEVQVRTEDLCYVIYTSGSTGRPKGVQIEHRSACNLVLGEGKIFQVMPEDRVCQAASISFDLSVEEIWLAFHAGATLVTSTQRMAQTGPDFAGFLIDNGVTVLSCVPTLLSMLEDDVPTLRLIILGGEQCPDWLVARWALSSRRLVNTYGPTEATVIATYADLNPGKQVTIGSAAPGYCIYVLDDSLHQVPLGTVGQICIGGIGIARGYVGLAKETNERFVPDPFAPSDYPHARMYLTGDLGRFNEEGYLEFIGRADGQVKLRGFRIELTEIESVLMQHDSVLAAACTVREDVPRVQQLVGYVIPRNGATIDENLLRLHLRKKLPTFMVPALIDIVSELPLLPSGKLDRASLPVPQSRQKMQKSNEEPRTDTEQQILNVWENIFKPLLVSIDDNFFLDLGGHSLLAARMVSELRKNARFAHLSVADVYEHPTIRSLGSIIDNSVSMTQTYVTEKIHVSSKQRSHARKNERQTVATIVQSLSLYPMFGLRAFEWITPYLVFFFLLENGYSMLTAVAWAATSIIAIFPILLVVSVAAKWLILGHIRPGRYPLWGRYYLRWWFVQTLVSSLQLDYLSGTPLLPFVYRLFGAKIGRDVHMATDRIAAFDLISIGDGSSIDDDASLLGYKVEDGELIIGQIKIGRGCFVGTRSVLGEDTVMEDGARLEDMSLLPSTMQIPVRQTWAGSPARWRSSLLSAPPRPSTRGLFYHVATTVLYGALILLLPLTLFVSILPGVILLASINLATHPFFYILSVPLVGASFVFFIAIEVILVKWLVVGRVRTGTYPVHGSYYIRNWIVDQLLALSIDLIGPLHATLYLTPWYRALGAKIGKFVELSTASTNTPDLLDIGDESTIADEVSLGVARIEGGWMTLAPTRLGRRTFVGNSAVIPSNTSMGEGSLLGVLSLAPPSSDDASKSGTSWLGSPPVLLPRRQSSSVFSEANTFRPTRKLRLTRSLIEIFRVTLPSAGFILVAAAVIGSTITLSHSIGLAATLFLLPIVYGACCAAVGLATVLAKWTVIGRFRPFEHPLWSTFVWRLEFVNALYEFLATPLVLEPLKGTLLLSAYSRLLGAKIGRGVYMHTTGLLEFDLLEVGDRVTLNDDCVMQTHLFEDRVLKSSHVIIGNDCSVGATAVILYDSEMEDWTKLDALSLLMKGETLQSRTAWAGLPARRKDNCLTCAH